MVVNGFCRSFATFLAYAFSRGSQPLLYDQGCFQRGAIWLQEQAGAHCPFPICTEYPRSTEVNVRVLMICTLEVS